jgi:hypothetical protein
MSTFVVTVFVLSPLIERITGTGLVRPAVALGTEPGVIVSEQEAAGARFAHVELIVVPVGSAGEVFTVIANAVPLPTLVMVIVRGAPVRLASRPGLFTERAMLFALTLILVVGIDVAVGVGVGVAEAGLHCSLIRPAEL